MSQIAIQGSKKGLNFGLVNTLSLCNKDLLLERYITDLDLELCLITKSWLNHSLDCLTQKQVTPLNGGNLKLLCSDRKLHGSFSGFSLQTVQQACKFYQTVQNFNIVTNVFARLEQTSTFKPVAQFEEKIPKTSTPWKGEGLAIVHNVNKLGSQTNKGPPEQQYLLRV